MTDTWDSLAPCLGPCSFVFVIPGGSLEKVILKSRTNPILTPNSLIPGWINERPK